MTTKAAAVTPRAVRDRDGAVGTLERAGVTLWRQIAVQLQADIAEGAWAAGARMPTEAQLSARFKVNRHTVRRALEELSREGLVRVEQGRGAFVAEDVLDYAVEPRTRFDAWIRKHNKEPSGRQLRCWTHRADRVVANGLCIPEGAPIVTLERLGLADDRPIGLSTHHFSLDRLPGMEAALHDNPRITDALRAVGVGDYMRQSTRVSARLPTASEATLLRTPRNRPLLVCENVNVEMQGQIIEFGVARYPTPRVQVVFEP